MSDTGVGLRTSRITGGPSAVPKEAGRRRWLLGIAVLSVAAVGLALWAQFRHDMQPCPWCILQRVIYLLIATVAVLGAVAPLRRTAGAAVVLLALVGGASAVYQHIVAANTESCALTLADRLLTRLALDKLSAPLFEVRGSCADAAVAVFGVPFDLWSLALFVAIGIAAMAVARAPSRR